MRKMLVMVIILAILSMTAGCIQIRSDITINSDLTGTYKAKILLVDPTILNKNQLEQKIKEAGIQSYTINEIKENVVINNNTEEKADLTGFEIILPWKNSDELKKIIVLKKAGTVGGNQNGKIVVPEPLAKDDNGLVTVNLGKSTDLMTIHVDGALMQDGTKGKIIDAKTIEFTANQPVVFQFTPTAGVLGMNVITLGVVAGGIFVAGGGLFYIRRKNRSNKEAM